MQSKAVSKGSPAVSRCFRSVAAAGLLSASAAALGAPGWTYRVIAIVPTVDFAAGARICSYALNDLGHVAYAIQRPGAEEVRLFDGSTDSLVHSAPNVAGPANVDCDPIGSSNNGASPSTVGLRNDGLVSFSIDVAGQGERLAYGRVGAGIQGTIGIPGTPTGFSFSPSINFANRIGFSGNALGTANEAGLVSAFALPNFGSRLTGYAPTINEIDQVAVLYAQDGATGPIVALGLHDPTLPTARGRALTIGPQATFNVRFGQPGLNDRGIVTFSTAFNLGGTRADSKVYAIDAGAGSTALITVADTLSGRFGSFGRATSINEFNQVAFPSGPFVQSGVRIPGGIHVGDVARSTPIDVATEGDTFQFGATTLQYSGSNAAITPHSLNEAGQVLFSASMPANGGTQNTEALVLATPAPGLTPGSPVLPAAGDTLASGGWRLRGCRLGVTMAGVCRTVAQSRRRYYDPPVAAGYTYTMDAGGPNFATVFIPAPLPGGDAQFTIEFAGQSATLRAGEEFDLTTRVAGGVSAFRITDIDLGEALSPTDPQAFVTGLSFVTSTEGPLSFTMVPIVENTDDPDLDGVIASRDNCPSVANPDQADGDGDGVGTACDNCPTTPNADQRDDDRNGVGNACEIAPRACSIDADGDIDRDDIALITAGRNQPASGPSDPRDPDRNGLINVLDSRLCATRCDRQSCATN
jgi:hypothetical protein